MILQILQFYKEIKEIIYNLLSFKIRNNLIQIRFLPFFFKPSQIETTFNFTLHCRIFFFFLPQKKILDTKLKFKKRRNRILRKGMAASLESRKYLRGNVLHRNGRVTGLLTGQPRSNCEAGTRRVSCLPLPNSAIFKWDCVRECNWLGKHGP